MKFNLGQWSLQPNTEAIFPLTVTDIHMDDESLTVSGFSHQVQARWSFIHGTLITARFTSPMPNVIRVQLSHFKGRQERRPNFDLDYSLKNTTLEIGCDETTAWL